MAVGGPTGVGGGVARHWAAPALTADGERGPTAIGAAQAAVSGDVERASGTKGVAAGGGSAPASRLPQLNPNSSWAVTIGFGPKRLAGPNFF
ncbi:hypothetical protein OsJ_31201 [Oryza sativa Japonica Group]|uniref:Uncharacterized protein n=3 Tax=Oryza sativa TaxID=4530 RepID=A0A979HK48_ORYSJ|nr:hypothetical protein [Oryza sativa Japonica Group]AAL79352.1 Hypothetical protein [Oryza sativa]AAP53281.1 hypothetical protein LOC_Os10g21500 [Oryza sativa Japonica Group]EAZ15782.1 hypothetical protein OsJ_31201 [Oryza sativa Japonica Group]